MKKLLLLLTLALLASCATRDCRHVAVDSYIRAVEQGQTARIVVGKVWEGAHVPADQRYHAEAQVKVGGQWRYLDGEPCMDILTVWTDVNLFKDWYMTKD